MTDYLTRMYLPHPDMYVLLKALHHKQWVAIEPPQNVIDSFGGNLSRLGSISMALLPDGLIFLEAREREHEMMKDARDAKKGARLSWIIAVIASFIAAGTWLFPRGGNAPTVRILPVVYRPSETGNAAPSSIPTPTVPAFAPAIGDSAKQDSVPESVSRR